MKKIMFNEEYGLNNAVLQGEKTNTRRDGHKVYLDYERGRSLGYYPTLTLEEYAMQKSPFKVGEIVAVAQSYQALGYDPMFCPPGHEYGLGNERGWSNKMYVSADLCRHHIRIDAVKFERLQNITDEDCLTEGVTTGKFNDFPKEMYFPYSGCKDEEVCYTARSAFSRLIDKVSGKGTWERNPYVFVYSFTLID